MIKRMWKTAKDWGLLGNMAWAAIAAGISVLLPFIANFLPFLNASVAVTVPIYLLIILPATLLIFITIFIKFYNNPNRIYGKLFGYYRKLYKTTCYPYNKYENGLFVSKIIRQMEFVITRDGVTTIGPYHYYSYEPRSANGVDEIIRPSSQCLVNEKASCVTCEIDISKSGNGLTDRDKLKLSIHTSVPFKAGDIVKFELTYEVVGQHASYREELNKYLNHPNLKDNYRNKAQKKSASEMFYFSARHSAKITIRVVFHEKFPWRHLDNFEDIFMISTGTRPVEKKAAARIARITSTSTSIDVEFYNGVGIEHGFYIFWMVPTKKELIAAGFANNSIENQK